MTLRSVTLVSLMLLAAAGAALAQDAPGGGGQQEAYNTTPEGGVGADAGAQEGQPQGQFPGTRPGDDAQNVGGFQASRGSGLFGLLIILGALGLGYLWYRRRGGRLVE